MPLEVSITNEQQVVITLHPVTTSGNPAPLDGDPAWTVVNGDSTVIPSGDGLSATLRSADIPGDTQFMVAADADIGPGTQTISDIITLHVAHANAANLGITAGDPSPKT